MKSPQKKLDLDENDKTTVTIGGKRKVSPIKTPENKKFKVDAVHSPDTQVSTIVFVFCVIYLNN